MSQRRNTAVVLKVGVSLVQISQRLGNRHIGRENRPASRRRNYLEYPSRPPMLGEGARMLLCLGFRSVASCRDEVLLSNRSAKMRTAGVVACMAFDAWIRCVHACVKLHSLACC